jgi:hypothetical protein
LAVLGCALVVGWAGAALAQATTTHEVKNGLVLAVQGNTLVVRGPEGVRRFEVPEQFKFNMGGRELTVHELKPGMRLTSIVTTYSEPMQMTETKEVSAEVLHATPGTVVVRTDSGEIKKYSVKELRESGVIVMRDGEPVDLTQLKKGQKLTATIVTERPPEIISESELQVLVSQAPPRVVRRPHQATPPPPAPAQPARRKLLPKTASRLPLIGLSGLLLVGVGLGLTLTRRFLL